MQNLEANSGLNEARTGFASDGCWGAPAENACVAQGVVRWHLWLVLGSAKTAPPGRRVIMKAGTPVLLESTGLQHLVVPWAASMRRKAACEFGRKGQKTRSHEGQVSPALLHL